LTEGNVDYELGRDQVQMYRLDMQFSRYTIKVLGKDVTRCPRWRCPWGMHRFLKQCGAPVISEIVWYYLCLVFSYKKEDTTTDK